MECVVTASHQQRIPQIKYRVELKRGPSVWQERQALPAGFTQTAGAARVVGGARGVVVVARRTLDVGALLEPVKSKR